MKRKKVKNVWKKQIYNLWDIYSESQIEQEVKRLEINEALL